MKISGTVLACAVLLCGISVCSGAFFEPAWAGTSPGATPESVVEGLETPWAIAFAPDGRIFVSERAGRVRVVKNGRLEAEPWMRLEVVEQSESGLLGLVLDPDFSRNRFVYAAYTYHGKDGRLTNRLARFREDPAKNRGSLDKILLDGVAGSGNHDGGRVKFGPDGKLYWSVGDAQNPSLAQDLSSLNGKILRLNADGTVPADNPFGGSPVYSYGHRNPQGLAWQPETRRLYATEHGPSGGLKGCCRDEVNLIERGANYGWSLITGDQSRASMVSPVLQSGDRETWAPAGAAFVTRGSWAGSLVFGGLRGESLYRVVFDAADPRKVARFERLWERQWGRLRDVVEGADGIYILTSNRDGRGRPRPGDDRIIRIRFQPQ